MNRKVFMFLILGSFLQLFQSQQTQAFDPEKFDPETTEFSRKKTLETWVAPIYQNEKDINEIQRYVASQVPQNPFSLKFRLPVENNPGDGRCFGRNFATISAIELPFLQFVKGASLENSIYTLEIGGSLGLVSWKVPFAFETRSNHYVNDLSETMLNGKFQQLIDTCLKIKKLKNSIHKLPGDCLTILDQHPELEGKFSAIFAQNVEHFFTPEQHQQFLGIISRLLKKDGRAFLSAESFIFWADDANQALRRLHVQKNLAGVVYSGFVSYQFTSKQGKWGTTSHNESKVSEVSYPTLEQAPGTRNILEETKGLDGYTTTKMHLVVNYFSPAIYRNAVTLHPTLEVFDTFFVTDMGERNESLNWRDGFSHAAVIIRKK